MATWLIYGAYGYTGRLIGREALKRDVDFAIAGRDAERIADLQAKWQVPGHVVSLDDHDALVNVLRTVDGVMHCAGPFEDTAFPMVEACLKAGTHYLDITGEWRVFEALRARHEAAQEAGVVLLPGTGFDVVPTDCVAATLAEAYPDATALSLGFVGLGSISRGTALTALRGWGEGSLMRRNGNLVRIPPGTHTRQVDIAGRSRTLTAIPWGDISTAYHSTGIPTISVYTYVPPVMRQLMYWSAYLPTWARNSVRPLIEALLKQTLDGPDAETRREGASWVWGEVQSPDGTRHTARWKGPEGYTLTARAAVECMIHALKTPPSPGYHTPSTAFGADLVAAVHQSTSVELHDAP